MEASDKRFYTRVAVTLAAILVLMVVGKLLFFSGRSSSGPALPSPSRSQVETRPGGGSGSKVISWQDAAEHYGESCTVEGTIVATHNSGKACFLNFHPNWREHFTAVIFASAFDQFSPNPEQHYKGKKVRVTGYIKEYKGKPEIILNSPDQIEILE